MRCGAFLVLVVMIDKRIIKNKNILWGAAISDIGFTVIVWNVP